MSDEFSRGESMEGFNSAYGEYMEYCRSIGVQPEDRLTFEDAEEIRILLQGIKESRKENI